MNWFFACKDAYVYKLLMFFFGMRITKILKIYTIPLVTYIYLAPNVMESLFLWNLFFVDQKQRPTEARFWAYKKRFHKKSLQWNAGLASEKKLIETDGFCRRNFGNYIGRN